MAAIDAFNTLIDAFKTPIDASTTLKDALDKMMDARDNTKASLNRMTVSARRAKAAAHRTRCRVLLLGGLIGVSAQAAVLPEDRADVLYHSYSGGGITIEGPAVLVRKGFKDKVSVHAKYYQDAVTSASIDVLTSGSAYREERDEYSVGMDVLVDRTLLSVGYTRSEEPDYTGETVSFDISQDFFGDMTTLSMGISVGDDTVRRRETLAEGEEAFKRPLQRLRYRLGLTQVMTRNWLVSVRGEAVIDEGYLQSPYAQVRYIDGSNPDVLTPDAGYQAEALPGTRSSDALSLNTLYYLPYRAALRFDARYFTDSWGIEAHNFEVRYTHPVRDSLILEIKGRTYAQTASTFYNDIFDYRNYAQYMTRRKEFSQFTSRNFGLGITYEFERGLPFAKKQSISLFWDLLLFDYKNYRNALLSRGEDAAYLPGYEPTYSFDANVIRTFFSIYY